MTKPNITPGDWGNKAMDDNISGCPADWGARYEIVNKDLFVGFCLASEDAQAIAAVPTSHESLETFHGFLSGLLDAQKVQKTVRLADMPLKLLITKLEENMQKAGYTFP